jgi:predicted patatin/cPLA2 family phospholipase
MVYDTICLSGSGIYAFAFIGALNKLINENIINIDNITTWIGTSGGAIISLIFSLGYSNIELLEFIYNFDFTILLPKKFKLFNFFKSNGLNNGNKFTFFFKQLIYNKFNVEDLTFKELFTLTNKKLIVTGTNFTKNSEEIFSIDLTPNMSIVTAVRISISIPLIFTPVLYKSDYYIDGGIKNFFPYNYCDPNKTFGLNIIRKHINNKLINILNIFKISLTMLSSSYRVNYNNSNIININIINDYEKNIIYNDIDLSKNNINNLINIGKTNIEIYLLNKSDDIINSKSFSPVQHPSDVLERNPVQHPSDVLERKSFLSVQTQTDDI